MEKSILLQWMHLRNLNLEKFLNVIWNKDGSTQCTSLTYFFFVIFRFLSLKFATCTVCDVDYP